MHILTIDGGGSRGIFAAHVLQRVEEEFQIRFDEKFDLIAGTSVGSIIAAALACGWSAKRFTALFKQCQEEIFEPRYSWKGMVRPIYNSQKLKSLLDETFKDTTLAETKTGLLITSADIANGRTHVFRSNQLEGSNHNRDSVVKIADAVLASCAAPLYFKPVFVEPYLLADGGLWAQNPSLVALLEAQKYFKCSSDEIKLLSIGTGAGSNYYQVKDKDNAWGLLFDWKIKKLVNLLSNLQATSVNDAVSQLLTAKRFVRVNFEADRALPLYSKNLTDLKNKADRQFTKSADDIEKLIGVER